MPATHASALIVSALVMMLNVPAAFGQANNSCSSPIALTLGGASVGGDTFGATNDGTSSCDLAGRDVWFSVTIPDSPNHVLRIELCGLGDPSVSIHSACGVAASACSETGTLTWCNALGFDVQVTLQIPGPTAGTRLIRVSDNNQGAFYEIRALLVAATFDTCNGATLVATPSSTAGTTVGASLDAGLSNCANESPTGGDPSVLNITSPGVWHRVVGTGGTITAEITAASFDTVLHAYSGTCASLTCVTANDDISGSSPNLSKMTFATASGQDYFILITGFGSATGTFTLGVRSEPTPANDLCANAIALSGSTGSMAGSTLGATAQAFTPAPNLMSTCASAAAFYAFFDVWYKLTAAADGAATLGTCGAYDTLMSVHTACPTQTQGNQIATLCNDNGPRGCGPGSQFSFAAVAGTTYWIRVAGAIGSAAGGNFTINWQAPALPCPADTNHDNAVNVTDLLAVIGGWGPCVSPPCAADTNSDGQINVTDLLAVIGAWGSCP